MVTLVKYKTAFCNLLYSLLILHINLVTLLEMDKCTRIIEVTYKKNLILNLIITIKEQKKVKEIMNIKISLLNM